MGESVEVSCVVIFTLTHSLLNLQTKMLSMSRKYAETLNVSQRAKFTRDFSKAYRDSDFNLQDWENVKYNNLKYSLPKPTYLTGYARQAELYLKHGILK